jgi:hypothetical protein
MRGADRALEELFATVTFSMIGEARRPIARIARDD